MANYLNGNPLSGINSIPRLTLAQYNALNVKPEFWVRTDAPESYKKLSADQVSYDSNNTVKDKIDGFIIEDIASKIWYNTQYSVWQTNTNELEKTGYKLVGVQLIATDRNNPSAPLISYQGNTLRIRGWDGDYTFIAMGVWVKV